MQQAVIGQNPSGAEQKKKRGLKWILLGLLACVFLAVPAYIWGIPALHYGMGQRHLDQGEIEKAYYALVRARGFGDSEDFLARIKVLPGREVRKFSGSELTLKYTYDKYGNLVKQERRWEGEAYYSSENVYHPAGIMLEDGEGASLVRDFVSDKNGNVSATAKDGGVRLTYDGNGLLLKSEQPGNDGYSFVYTYQYDSVGRLLKETCTDSFGAVTQVVEYVYSSGKLINEVVKNGDGTVRYTRAAYTYDKNGFLERMETIGPDGVKNTVEYERDRYGLCEKEKSGGRVSQFSDYQFFYTAPGENRTLRYNEEQYKKACAALKKGDYEEAYEIFYYLGDFKDAESYFSQFKVLPTLISDPGSALNSVQYTYDENGTVIEKKVRGKTTVYGTDGQVLRELYESSSDEKKPDEVVYTYDDSGKLLSVGPDVPYLRIPAKQYFYNEAGVLLKHTETIHQKLTAESYYNEDGSLRLSARGLSSPEKQYTVYSYDASGRVLEQKDYTSLSPYVEGILPADALLKGEIRYSYDENHGVLEQFFQNGEETMRKYSLYDEEDRLVFECESTAYAARKKLGYRYDDSGRLIAVIEYVLDSDKIAVENEVTYTTDRYGRLESSYNSFTKERLNYGDYAYFYQEKR